MNIKRLILAILVVFVAVFFTDFLIHGVWLKSVYLDTASLWRPEDEMGRHFGWLLLGQFFAAATFVVIWSKGFPATSSLGGACLYGLCMGLFSEATTIILYAVQPFPADLAVKWFVSGLARGTLMGAIVFFVGRPKPADDAAKP